MPNYMYVSLQDDDKILVLAMDAGTGKLTPKGELPVAGGPSSSAISPDRKSLYLEVWPESHWPGFALREADVL